MDDLKRHIREVPDFPKPGILFYDITTLLADPQAFRTALDRFEGLFAGLEVDKVVGIESRGFLFAPHLAYRLGAGFVPVRKPGKLPWETVSEPFELEYGVDELHMHRDAVEEGERVLVIDDVIATGGTAAATARLVESCGGTVAALGFVIEISGLAGRDKLGARRIDVLLRY